MLGQFDVDGDLWITAFNADGSRSKINLTGHMRDVVKAELGDDVVIQVAPGEVAEVRAV